MGVCDDLISRQAAIDAIWKALYEYEDKMEKQFQESDELDVSDWIMNDQIWVQNGHNLCVDVLTKLLSAQRWIPVSERLPEDEVDVLVTDDSGGYATIGIDCMFTRLNGKREWLASQRVTAWMPAPAPYKEKSR